jgi:hypothetical protein
VLIVRAAVIAVVFLGGCSRKGAPAAPAEPPRLPDLPIEMTVAQRSTTPVPGSEDGLRLTIDDVTRGQVVASLSARDGTVVLAPVSLEAGKSAPFTFRGHGYVLKLTSLKNALMGQDAATFQIAAGKERALDETAKIERLLEAIANEKDAVFVRNKSDHEPREAADHLRSKWSRAKEIASARRFIDEIATRSSLSGEPYQVRFSDGRVVPLADWLNERLAALDR